MMAKPEKSLDNLEHGDVIECGDYARTVIDVLPHSVFLSCIDAYSLADRWYTLAMLKFDGWTLKAPTDTVEVTRAEIAEKFGVAVDRLRVVES